MSDGCDVMVWSDGVQRGFFAVVWGLGVCLKKSVVWRSEASEQ